MGGGDRPGSYFIATAALVLLIKNAKKRERNAREKEKDRQRK